MSDDIGQSVRDRLGATTSVKQLVAARVYADVLPQKVDLPAVVVAVTGNTPHEDLNNDNRIYQSTVFVLAYGEDRTQANALARAIRSDALAASLRGRIEGMDWSEVSLTDGPNESVDQPQDGSDQWRKITTQTFVIWNSPV